MKKLFFISTMVLFAASMALSSCRKPPMDKCEGVTCDKGYKCVDGVCVEMRKP